jgi:hypothetical protein
MRRVLTSCLYCCSLFAFQGPPGPDLEAQKEAMKKLSFLAGKWVGEATATMGPQGPIKMQQTEDVQYRLDGLVLLIEGTGRDSQDKVVFNALATVSYDEAAKQYRIRAYNRGRYLDTELKVGDREFEWGYQAGTAKIINKMKLGESGEWTEVGEVTLPNQPPRKFVEFTVKKRP